MQKIIKTVDAEKKIVQITICDERWYSKPNPEKPEELIYVPSITWISSFYPKGVRFYKWLSQRSWDESQAIKLAAGDKGSKTHSGVGSLIDGETVEMDREYPNSETGIFEKLGVKEYECLMSFVNWWKDTKPAMIAREMVVFDDIEGYAGTLDLICRVTKPQTKKELKEGKEPQNELWIIDFKTSPNIWPSFELQVSAYKNALIEMLLAEEARGEKFLDVTIEEVTKAKLGILQLGYRTRKGYKFTEIEDKYDLFLSAKRIWKNETEGVEVSKKDYPIELQLKEKEKCNHSGERKNGICLECGKDV